MLTGDQILLKIVDAQKGDEQAKVDIINSNIPLIKSIVRRYRNKQIEYDDLMQLGTLGLIKAINNFDMAYGVRFSTYAVPMIAGEIKRFIRDDGAIKVSRSIKSQAQKINQFIESYRHTHQQDPSIDELSKEFSMDATDIVFIQESVRYPLSIYAETEEEGLSLADRIAAKGSPEETIDKMLLRDIINDLPEREKKIILLRYFRDMTQSEIAKQLNVSQVQISRLEAKILEKMRKELL